MNKYWAKTLKITCIVLFLTTGANLFSSCNDDLPADSYYTFTGEMMSDFLQTREDFSLFRLCILDNRNLAVYEALVHYFHP